jgi:hypothetical protein
MESIKKEILTNLMLGVMLAIWICVLHGPVPRWQRGSSVSSPR